jgi:hypothetical protein
MTSLLLALVGHSSLLFLGPVVGSMEWEEIPVVQKLPGYHPMLRFQPTSASAYGTNTSSTFLFASPDYIAEGHYQRQGGHYVFHPETCFQCNNTDLNRLVADLDPETQRNVHEAYARSMRSFEADYSQSTGIFRLTYPVNGVPLSFELHSYTEGDDRLSSSVSGSERSMPGVWHSPEPFPDKLDSKTRFRIGDVDGLQQFSKEAKASDAAQFGLLDLRTDKSFRNHATEGTWERSGSILKLFAEGKETDLSISQDGQQLIAGGKVVYVRN